MKKVLSWLDRYWHLFLIGGCIGAQALVFLFFGEESYLTVQDNLDLFIAHFQVMNWQDGWFAQGATMPMLGGISRDCLSSEWNLYNILFAILPVFPAYMIGYFLKIFLGMGSFALLAKDIWPETFARYRQIAWTAGLCYGMLPLFPAYGLAFASIPLFVFLCRRIYFRKGRIWYAALFFYPLLSYFSYFGFFLLAYLACAAAFLSVRDKKPCGRLIAALFLLAAGYVCFEYRLFSQMLFSDVETIRVSMVDTDLDAGGILGQIWEAFVMPVFHASSDHAAFVLPVCLAFLLWRAAVLIRSGQARKFLSEGILWVLLFILFNCVVNGLYYWGGFRRLFETLIPPLKGFQFNRTTFFNPFLWYAALFLVLKYLYDAKKDALEASGEPGGLHRGGGDPADSGGVQRVLLDLLPSGVSGREAYGGQSFELPGIFQRRSDGANQGRHRLWRGLLRGLRPESRGAGIQRDRHPGRLPGLLSPELQGGVHAAHPSGLRQGGGMADLLRAVGRPGLSVCGQRGEHL